MNKEQAKMNNESQSDATIQRAKHDTLVRRCGQIKGRLTRINTFINNFDPNQQSVNLLSTRLDILNECWKEFNTTQTEIEDIQIEDLNTSEIQNEDFEDKYFNLRAKI